MKEIIDLIYLQADTYTDQKSHTKTNKNERHLLYGEITREGIEKLVKEIPFTSEDVVLDIGSGRGKAICQLSILTDIKKGIGIEIVKERHDLALKLVKDTGPYENVEFLCEDIFKVPEILSEATIIIANCLAFSPDMIDEIIKLIPKGKTVILSTPQKKEHFADYRRLLHLPVSWLNGRAYPFYLLQT